MIKFFENENIEDKRLYIQLLKITGSLSNLFAESENPFLHYRAMENIFCKAFKSENLSRGDISIDTSKNRIGIGLKTFLQNNGNTFQKIAEFNKQSHLINDLKPIDLVLEISKMRNERIEITKRICNLDKMIYHLITRSKNYMAIYEENMEKIDIENIKILKIKNSTILFMDTKNEYTFNISKSTLLKKFNTKKEKEIYGFDVEILKDPYEFLLKFSEEISNGNLEIQIIEKTNKNELDYIILPLYSTRSKRVEEKSGLNQWNAGGRERDKDEVYISIPSWIHKEKKGFFSYNTNDFKTNSFNVKLPNGKTIKMKVAQQGGKALMSNPNKDLGKWILREILKIEENQLVTKEMLDFINIDSIKLTKIDNNNYILDFSKSGSYEEFENEIKNKEKGNI